MPTNVIVSPSALGRRHLDPQLVWRVSIAVALLVYCAFVVALCTSFPDAFAAIAEVAGP